MDKPSWEIHEEVEDNLATRHDPEGDWITPADRDRNEHLREQSRHALDLSGCLPWWNLALVLLTCAASAVTWPWDCLAAGLPLP